MIDPSARQTTQAGPAASTNPIRDARAQIGAWLMVASPAGFVAYIVFGVLFFAGAKVGIWSEIDRATMDRVLGGWVAGQVLVLIPYLLGLVGGILLALPLLRSPGSMWARVALAVSALAIAGNVAYSGLMIAAAGFPGTTMADSSLALMATGPVVQFWSDPASWASVALLGLALRRASVRPRLGLAVAIIATVGTVAAFATGFMPPFALSFLWVALGIGWLTERRKVR